MAQIFRVERTKNFTVMSNHHFKNKKLTSEAKGYEAMTVRKIQRNGGMLV